MKITSKDLVQDRKKDDDTPSPCCSISSGEDRCFYVSVPVTEDAIKGLVLGESVELTVKGVLKEVRSRWSPEVEIEVGEITLVNSKNDFEALIDEEDDEENTDD